MNEAAAVSSHGEAVMSNAARDLLVFMPRKKLPMLGVGSVVVAKCRELWEGLTGGGSAVARGTADDYFRGSYEFSCTATPVVPAMGRGCGRRRRQRRLPPCVGGRQAREMLAASVIPGGGWSPESSPGARAGYEIDGLAEEFINRFHKELRMERLAELQAMEGHEARPLSHLARSVPVI